MSKKYDALDKYLKKNNLNIKPKDKSKKEKLEEYKQEKGNKDLTLEERIERIEIYLGIPIKDTNNNGTDKKIK